MSITIDLPMDVQRKLAEKASAAGISIESAALEMIAKGIDQRRSLDELLAPVRAQFQTGGLKDEDVADLVEEVREEIWQENQMGKKP